MPDSAQHGQPPALRGPDAALAAALTDRGGVSVLLTLDELADSAQLSVPLLEALVREGLLVPRVDDPPRFAASDGAVVTEGLRLVEAGVPLAELLDLARRTDAGLRAVAEHAVDVFMRFVRDRVIGEEADGDVAAARLVAAFDTMLPATGRLLSSHFERLVVEAARARIAAESDQGRTA